MSIKLVIASYGRQLEQIKLLRSTLPKDVSLVVIDRALDEMVSLACEIERSQSVDVFLASGGNSEYLRKYVQSPVVTIHSTGTDILFSVSEAMHYSDRIGVVTYGKTLQITKLLNSMISATLYERSYSNQKDLLRQLEYMRSNKERENSRRLSSILTFAREGIIATDRENRIIEFNPSAEKLTGLSREQVLGGDAREIIPNSRLDRVIRTRQKELDAIQDIGSTKLLTNRVPIISDGEVIGALATFQSVEEVRSAEENIRRSLRNKSFTAKTRFDDIIGSSPAIYKAKRRAELYSHTDSTVLIKGESGTGKELFAQSIHNASPRSASPFVAVNCAAVSRSLLESELFGYASGAFTGAKREGKKGIFELADGGTIFLDEISEMDFDLQAKLLRVLEQHEVMRLGSETLHPVNIRVIAATNRNLWQLVEEERFRHDLYYRLNVLSLQLPPLRSRPGDLPLLAEYFLREYCPELDSRTMVQLSHDPVLQQYSWPGNIRELRNLVERYSILQGEPGIATIGDFLLEASADRPALLNQSPPARQRIKCSDEAIRKALLEYKGNQSKAAAHLGISRTTLWRWTQRHS